ncbi:MAG: pantetheine-phosphate adenylyltransferase [Dehalococcoidia bacterium]|nr:pantetheine-phosphate adenylyltransferase [Dehalococcoidia bacterium]
MRKAMYPGSFDPLTNGHMDIIIRAAKLFDELVVAIYETPSKNLLFSVEERTKMVEEATASLGNVTVAKYSGLTVDFARRMSARVMIRGLRAVTDFESEFPLAMMNKRLASDIETVALYTNTDFQLVSSSLLKEVVSLGGSVHGLVPPNVEVALKKAFSAGENAG